MNTVIPLQAEAEAILWAGQLSVSHGFSNVIIESDCKACVDVVNALGNCPWLIQSLMVVVVDVLSDLIFWKLCWVRRSANRAPHVFAKWSQLHLSWGPLNFCFGPPSFVSVCNADLVGSVSYF